MITSVVVVVPARNEEELVERCLAGLADAVALVHRLHPAVSTRVVVVVDRSTDRTLALCQGSPGVETVVTDAGRVGAARARGVALALSEVGGEDPAGIWIANTDADSCVPAEWLTSQIVLADAGADVVVGTVRPDPADLTALQNAHWLATHVRGRPNGHVHGANLGLRASAYLNAGGFEALDEHEDNQLVARLKEADVRIVASDAGEVLTSGRPVGRTPGGYAHYLASTL